MILLDSDIVIDFLRGVPTARTWFAAQHDALAMPGFVAMEIYAGCRDAKEQRKAERELARVARLWLTPDACEAALAIYAKLHLSHNVGVLDALIGQTALTHGLPLHTFNRKHFLAIPGLRTIQPYSK